jgi:hypothetical protein
MKPDSCTDALQEQKQITLLWMTPSKTIAHSEAQLYENFNGGQEKTIS